MRVVIDTNVIVSGLYDLDSPPGKILRAGAAGELLLCAPESVRKELMRVLKRALGYSGAELATTLEALPVEWIEAELYRPWLAESEGALRDPEDAPVLACGLALECDIVSGEKDLIAAKPRRIRIWTPAELVGRR